MICGRPIKELKWVDGWVNCWTRQGKWTEEAGIRSVSRPVFLICVHSNCALSGWLLLRLAPYEIFTPCLDFFVLVGLRRHRHSGRDCFLALRNINCHSEQIPVHQNQYYYSCVSIIILWWFTLSVVKRKLFNAGHCDIEKTMVIP